MAKKWDEVLADLSQKLEDLSKKTAVAADDAKAARELRGEAIHEKIGDTKGNIAAMQENIRIAEEENKSKLSTALLKAQMTIRAKAEDRKEARDKKHLERYIDDHIDYILDCYDTAALLVLNAQLAILETMDAAMEYEERFGELVLEEKVSEENTEEKPQEKPEAEV
ncbi:MAG: hypothetical protein IKE81_06915 [Clostridia bacterium]|jgi:hypothetical protein|nr:hypothetical protein [Clostridia bacterium]